MSSLTVRFESSDSIGASSQEDPPSPDLASRIDRAVMDVLFHPDLSYGKATWDLVDNYGQRHARFEGKDCLRLLGRVARNVAFSFYGPVQIVAFALLHPVQAVQRMPSWLLQNLKALLTLDHAISLTASSFGTAATLSTVFGCAVPVSAVLVLGGMAAMMVKTCVDGREKVHHAILLWLESFLTGMALGIGTAWVLRRKFASQLEALRESVGQKWQLSGSETGFVNTNNQAVFCLNQAQTEQFLGENKPLAAEFYAAFKREHGWAVYDPHRVVIHGADDVSVAGRYFLDSRSHFGGGRTETYKAWWFSTSQAGFPSMELQSGLRSSLISSPGVALGQSHAQQADRNSDRRA